MADDDISELKRAKDALAASETRLSLVLKGSNDGWWDWDLVAGQLFYSPRWWAMLGYVPDELPADQALWVRLMHPDDVERVQRLLGDLLAHGPDTAEVEFRLRHKDGHYVPVLSRGHIVRGPDGQPWRLSGANTDLTARHQAEAALRESQAGQQALFEAMADGVFVAQDHRFVFANPALPAMLGYDLEAFVGLHFDQVVHPDFLALWTERFDRRVSTDPEPPRYYEVRFVRRGGASSLWLDLRANRFSFRGAPAVLGIVRDIGERKLAEQRIDSLRQRLALAIQGAGYGVWEFDLRTGRLIWDEQMLALYGHTPASFDGSSEAWRRGIHPDDRDEVDARFADLKAGRRVDHLRFRIVRAHDGAVRHVEANGFLQLDAEGGAQRLVGMNRDVTAQVESEGALRASEERWKFAIEGAGDGVWDWDLPRREVLFSLRWKQMLGHRDDEIGPDIEEWRGRIHPDDLGPARDRLRDHLQGLTPNYAIEYRLRCKDGGWKWILSRGLVVSRDAAGRALRLVGTHTDLSERKQAEATRARLETQLREAQKMEAIGTLAGGVAHDFNNVLAGILINVQLAQQDLGPGHPALASLEQIHQASQRARNLVQQILAFSRRQDQQLLKQPMRPLVEEALALLRSTLPAGVELEPRLSERPLHAMADGTQMQQVLMNLCTNAWHALQGRAGRIVVGLEPVLLERAVPAGLVPGRHVHLWVSDNGCGMDAAARARIFEPFYTTKPVGQGTGLGLSVVHGIVATHGGAISVDSAPAQGSSFHIYLPQVEPPATAPAAAGGGAAPRGGGQHVLYIDDDEIMVLTVERLLQRAGYRVTCFQEAEAALAAVRGQPAAFDLVVTDFNMPGHSGLDVARELAALNPALPVVMSSGYISEPLRADAQRWGVRALLHKENTVEELAGLVHRVLAAAR